VHVVCTIQNGSAFAGGGAVQATVDIVEFSGKHISIFIYIFIPKM
jgi:hypothetical protein